MALLGGALEWLLAVPDWVALAAIFLFPALEASALLGIVVPGEAAIVIGGALASQGRISLAAALAAAIAGAIVGDSVGYSVGKRWGRKMIPRLSRRPRRKRQVERAEAFLRDHPGWTITIGRFPPGLRTIVPGLAGMSRVGYRSFLFYNVLGGVVWGSTFVLLGYAAGRNWRRAEALASGGGIAMLAAVLLALWAMRSFRRGRLARFRGVLRRARSA